MNQFPKPSYCITAGVLGPAQARGVKAWLGLVGTADHGSRPSLNEMDLHFYETTLLKMSKRRVCVAASSHLENGEQSWAKTQNL